MAGTAAKKAPRKQAPKQTAKYVALKAMTIGGRDIKPGDPVPEAEGWTRVESWIRHRYIKEA